MSAARFIAKLVTSGFTANHQPPEIAFPELNSSLNDNALVELHARPFQGSNMFRVSILENSSAEIDRSFSQYLVRLVLVAFPVNATSELHRTDCRHLLCNA